jgi:hypothetical protein
MTYPPSFIPKHYPCKFCGAPAGQNCANRDGSKRDWSHIGRGPAK